MLHIIILFLFWIINLEQLCFSCYDQFENFKNLRNYHAIHRHIFFWYCISFEWINFWTIICHDQHLFMGCIHILQKLPLCSLLRTYHNIPNYVIWFQFQSSWPRIRFDWDIRVSYPVMMLFDTYLIWLPKWRPEGSYEPSHAKPPSSLSNIAHGNVYRITFQNEWKQVEWLQKSKINRTEAIHYIHYFGLKVSNSLIIGMLLNERLQVFYMNFD